MEEKIEKPLERGALNYKMKQFPDTHITQISKFDVGQNLQINLKHFHNCFKGNSWWDVKLC